ncbi:MAG: riboflavin biosynthesis protein RibF, partial [Planctomycetota bacterium]|nr:riboflavin biosynthesis protein RibF [Planctomycetota bacterium]
ACVVLKFDNELASVSAEDFALQYFRDWLSSKGALLGFDCRFGRGARGNIDLLERMSPELCMEVRAFEQQSVGSLVPSSTAIRKAIRTADLEAASAMLGRPVSILGEVVEGDRRGSTIGFPTANIAPHHEILPPIGVYACTVSVEGRTFKAVSNIGVRPTVSKAGDQTIETHILDYEGDLYGQVLEVEFHRLLRPEKQFSGLDDLREQIAKDTEEARRTLEEIVLQKRQNSG